MKLKTIFGCKLKTATSDNRQQSASLGRYGGVLINLNKSLFPLPLTHYLKQYQIFEALSFNS